MMLTVESEAHSSGDVTLVPVQVGEQTVLLSITQRGVTAVRRGEEQEIAARKPTIEQAMDGVAEFSRELVRRLHGTKASKISVEFGCELAMESGHLLAVIGKVSADTTIKIGLEWSEPES